jgi:hypothetical protein
MEGVKRIEDLDLSIFCTQGTVGVGVSIPIFTAPFPRADYRRTTLVGSALNILSFCP